LRNGGYFCLPFLGFFGQLRFLAFLSVLWCFGQLRFFFLIAFVLFGGFLLVFFELFVSCDF
jgi:hypothetical protein